MTPSVFVIRWMEANLENGDEPFLQKRSSDFVIQSRWRNTPSLWDRCVFHDPINKTELLKMAKECEENDVLEEPLSIPVADGQSWNLREVRILHRRTIHCSFYANTKFSQSTNQSMDQSIDKSINQSINRPESRSTRGLSKRCRDLPTLEAKPCDNGSPLSTRMVPREMADGGIHGPLG